MGDDVPKFLFANGPGRIVRYNFNSVKSYSAPHLATRRQTGAKPDLNDIFELTPAGLRCCNYSEGSRVGWSVER